MFPLEIIVEPAQQLCSESLSARTLPANFDENDKTLFKHEFQKTIPATQLLELNHVNISPDGIVFRAGRILAESFGYRNLLEAWSTPKDLIKFFVKNHVSRKKERLDDKSIWVIDNWSGAYFHWLTDTLSRLYVVRDRLADSVLLLLESYKNSGYILPSLAPFEIHNIKFIGQNQVFRCRKLLVPNPHCPERKLQRKRHGRSQAIIHRILWGNAEC